MSFSLVGVCAAAMLALLPFLIQLYMHRLPVAPTCPSCRATTRELNSSFPLLDSLFSLTTTSRGECGRCGWRGRMRWRWATRKVRGDGG